MSRLLGRIAAELGGQLLGDPNFAVQRLASLATAQPADLAFVAHARLASQIKTTLAGALIVPLFLADAAQQRGACIVCDDPYLYFAKLTQWWRQQHEPAVAAQIDPLASVHPTALIGPDVSIAPFAVIGARARIGAGARIGPHAVVEQDAVVGEHTRLAAHVVVGERCCLGARCIVHGGAVIGADGFGFAPDEGRWVKIEQLGAVQMGDDVEIGANTCIDRGALDDTVIGNGVKLDNLIQIAHNVRIGDHTAMAGFSGVAGSTTIGAHCTIGGAASVLGHLQLADGVNVSAASVVTRSIREPGHYTGFFPIDDNVSWEKNAASLKRLNRLRERVKALEQAASKAKDPPQTP